MSGINGPASGEGAVKASPQRHYATMTVAEICALSPPSAEQAHLWLWVLSQHVDWGYEVARAWGFEPLQMITWCKPGLGAGRFQCNTEHVLLCRKGPRHGNPFGMTAGTYFNWPRGKHSQKPAEFFSLVEKVSPEVPRLEMFARATRAEWHVWGNEVESDCIIQQGANEMSEFSVDQMVAVYVKIRDARKFAASQFKIQDSKLKNDMRTVENEILRMAQEAGVTGFTIKGIGTTYTKEEMHVSISSDPEFYEFLRDTQDFEFLTRRISLKHTQDWMKLHGGQLPPGLKKYGELRMRIRGPGADPDDDGED